MFKLFIEQKRRDKLVDEGWTISQGVLYSCYKAQYGSVYSEMDRCAWNIDTELLPFVFLTINWYLFLID